MITQLENRLGCHFQSLKHDMWHIKGNNCTIIKYYLKHKCSLFLPEDSDVKDSCGLKAKMPRVAVIFCHRQLRISTCCV